WVAYWPQRTVALHTPHSALFTSHSSLRTIPCFLFSNNHNFLFPFFHPSNHPRIDAEALRDLNHRFSVFFVCIDLHSRTHVEHLVHLTIVGSACFANDVEHRRWREEVVLYHSKVRWKVFHALGLSATAAVD